MNLVTIASTQVGQILRGCVFLEADVVVASEQKGREVAGYSVFSSSLLDKGVDPRFANI